MAMKVVILYSQSLFAAGVESHLRDVEDMEVIRLNAADQDALLGIDEYMPNVVIVDVNDRTYVNETEILRALAGRNSSCVISLDLNTNQIAIYRREERTVLSGSDLAGVILDQVQRD